MMAYRKYILASLLAVSAIISVYPLESLGAMGGILYSANSSEEGAPSPVLPFIGIASSFRLGEKTFIEPSMVLTANYYLWSAEEEIALPAEIEYADSVLLLSAIIDFPYVMKYPLREKLDIGWAASPVLILRIPLRSWGEGQNSRSDILSYFYGGRFIFLEAGGLAEWKYATDKSLKGRFDVLFPVYHLWDGGEITDQFSIRLSFIFSFMRKEVKEENSNEEKQIP